MQSTDLKKVFQYMREFACVVLSLSVVACSSYDSHTDSTLDSYQKALRIVTSAYNELGGIEKINVMEGIYLEGKGNNYLATRYQGKYPPIQEKAKIAELLKAGVGGSLFDYSIQHHVNDFNNIKTYPIIEKLVIKPDQGLVAFETNTYANADARKVLRHFYDGQNRYLLLDLYNNFGFWDSRHGINRESKRYSNIVPHLLLREAIGNQKNLKYLGRNNEGNNMVSFHSPDLGSLTLYINSSTNYLKKIEYLRDLELRGDTPIVWEFKEYQFIENIGPYPSGYTIKIQDQLLKDISYQKILAGVKNTAVTVIPDSIQLPEIPNPPTDNESTVLSETTNEIPIRDPLSLAQGVYVFPHIRSGFHPMVVEFKDYFMVIDAPANWRELNQLPTPEWEEGENSSSVGWRLKEAIQQKLPDKPIRYLVLTHHHGDHIGGFRPFVANGTTILTTPTTAKVIEQALKQTYTYAPDSLSGKKLNANVELVKGNYSVSDDSMEVQLIDVGENPHSEGMLVVYLPNEKILFNSDLFEPINSSDFPSKARVPIMKWFVNWLDHSGLDYERVYSMHAGLRVSDNHMEYIRNLEQNDEPFRYP